MLDRMVSFVRNFVFQSDCPCFALLSIVLSNSPVGLDLFSRLAKLERTGP